MCWTKCLRISTKTFGLHKSEKFVDYLNTQYVRKAKCI
jgi:hypothetical protein